MVEPIGWSSMRSSLHYKSVFPTVPDVGMQVTLHKNLTKRLQPKELIALNQNNIDMARKILHRQRVALRLYSGSRLNLKGSTPHETSSRLHRQANRYSNCHEGSDAYSNMRSEGSTMITEASLYGPPRESLTRDGTLPSVYRGMTPIPQSARSFRSDMQRSGVYDPEKAPDSRGYLVRLKKPIVYKKKYTEAEIQNIVHRLTDYDPATHPAESKGQMRERPAVVTQVPRQSMTRIKKCTAEEVQEIVERLYTFDSAKWPPESKVRPVIHSGRPRHIQTAPARVPAIGLSDPGPAPAPEPTPSQSATAPSTERDQKEAQPHQHPPAIPEEPTTLTETQQQEQPQQQQVTTEENDNTSQQKTEAE